MVKYHNIQIVRSVSAAAVLAYHLGRYEELAYGHATPFSLATNTPLLGWSVCLFFVISGFVVAHSLQNTTPGKFLARRLIRIFPAYWLAVAIAYVVRLQIDMPPPALDHHFLYALTLLPIAPEHSYILIIEWTLVIEISCYLVSIAFASLGGYRGVVIGAACWLTVCLIRIALWPERALAPLPGWQRVLISGYDVPFALGMLAHALREHGRSLRPLAIPAAVTLLLSSSIGVLPSQWAFVAYSLGSGLVIWLAATGHDADVKSLLVRYGDWTYGLYLLHPTILCAIFFPLARRGVPDSLALVAFAAAASVLIGCGFGSIEVRVSSWVRDRLIRRPPIVRSQPERQAA
jgi:exopolysaccharide production protein ExoZ